MWDTLKDSFLDETNSAGAKATARAVIAYCNGKSVFTFIGETHGTLADSPRGSSKFYWDTVFIPDRDVINSSKLTYAEIVEQEGLEAKIKDLSQSSKAMKKFLEHYRNEVNEMWI